MARLVFFVSLILFSTARAEKQESRIKLSWVTDFSMDMKIGKTILNILLTPTTNIPGHYTRCLFQGEVEDDPGAAVAVSGCRNSSETLVTIASSLVPGGILDLSLVDGITYNVVFNNRSGAVTYRKRKKRRINTQKDYFYPPSNPIQSFAPETEISTKLPSKVALKTNIKYDNTLLEHFQHSHLKTKDWINRVVSHAKARMSHESLNLKVDIKIKEVDHIDENLRASRYDNEGLIHKYKFSSLTSYFCKDICPEEGGCDVGNAAINSACREDGFASNINELYTTSETEISTGRVFAHELGHVLGMEHDDDERHGGSDGKCSKKGMMMEDTKYLKLDKWSDCSNSDFENYWRVTGFQCLREVEGVCDERKGSEVIEYCRPRITMWTYDKKSNQCLPFFGCKGDGNRFESKEECDRKCA